MGSTVRVRVFPDVHAPHVLQVLAGLGDLAATGVIDLKYTRRLCGPVRTFAAHTLWVEIDVDGAEPIGLCFDMGDGNGICSLDGLEKCRLYFKRSYSPATVQALPVELQARVVPYGLNYGCVGRHDRWPQALLATLGSRLAGFETIPRRPADFLRRLMYAFLAPTPLGGSSLSPFPGAGKFEVPPDAPAAPAVTFQTRLWKSNGDASVEYMNEQRATLVREMRLALGRRLIGGLQDEPIARERYPELLSNAPTDKRSFMRTVRDNLVGVTTVGLFDSTGWKVPEYLAASRCIVSEPLRFALPVPLEAGRHFLPFVTPQQCVVACERLLDHPGEAEEMRRANFAYYLEHVQPAALIGRCLRRAEAELRKVAVPEVAGAEAVGADRG